MTTKTIKIPKKDMIPVINRVKNNQPIYEHDATFSRRHTNEGYKAASITFLKKFLDQYDDDDIKNLAKCAVQLFRVRSKEGHLIIKFFPGEEPEEGDFSLRSDCRTIGGRSMYDLYRRDKVDLYFVTELSDGEWLFSDQKPEDEDDSL